MATAATLAAGLMLPPSMPVSVPGTAAGSRGRRSVSFSADATEASGGRPLSYDAGGGDEERGGDGEEEEVEEDDDDGEDADFSCSPPDAGYFD